jgi:hypothetical protein
MNAGVYLLSSDSILALARQAQRPGLVRVFAFTGRMATAAEDNSTVAKEILPAVQNRRTIPATTGAIII